MMKCVILILSLIIPTSAGAVNWYVDNAVAASGNGQSWGTAWKNFSNIVWGTSGVKAGDTLYISGGPVSKTYTNSLVVQAAGVSGSPIAIRAGQDANHNGVVIFDFSAQGNAATATAIEISQRNYVTISGNTNGENHILIRNLVNISDRYSGCGIFGFGASTSNRQKGVLIENVDFANINNGIRLAYIDGSEIRNCNITGVRGDCAIELVSANGAATWDDSKVHDNQLELLINGAIAPGHTEANGPDGIQGQNGISIYNNFIKAVTTNAYTSDQHSDQLQITGRYIKVYGNEFVNTGDSVINYGTSSAGTVFSDLSIYNNIFRTEQTIDGLPEYIRLYASASYGGGTASVSAINNIKILNNVFIDNNNNAGCASSTPGWSYCPVQITDFGTSSNPTATGNEIRNNIFVNVGSGSNGPAINIGSSSNFTSNSFVFSNNVYSSASTYIKYNGSPVAASSWIANQEGGTGKVGIPQFVSYTARSASNDLHLKAADAVAKDAGASLASTFTTDKDGTSRPQGAGWDMGPFEYSGTASSVPHPADSNTDYVIGLNEATTFGACWKTNCNANATLDNASRAGFLWKASATGAYQYNSAVACPLCWEIKP